MTWVSTIAMGGLSLLAVLPCRAQKEGVPFGDREMNLTAYIELLRSDIQAQRVTVITEVMQFDEENARKFWPIYRQYQTELTALNDVKVGVIRDYAEHYENFTDANADRAANSMLEFEAKRVALKKKYYERLKNALSAKTAARYFQVENQIQMLLDLQVSSMLPAMK
jgi:hypothetical protein